MEQTSTAPATICPAQHCTRPLGQAILRVRLATSTSRRPCWFQLRLSHSSFAHASSESSRRDLSLVWQERTNAHVRFPALHDRWELFVQWYLLLTISRSYGVRDSMTLSTSGGADSVENPCSAAVSCGPVHFGWTSTRDRALPP